MSEWWETRTWDVVVERRRSTSSAREREDGRVGQATGRLWSPNITREEESAARSEGQSRVRRTNGGGRSRSAMTRARAIPANRAIPSLYTCIWRWRSPGSLVSFGGFQRGNGECNRDIGARTGRSASARRSASAAVGVRAVREIGANTHRLLGRACIAQARPRWPVPCPRSVVVVVVMEARSVPIDTPAAAEYRPWRLPLSRVTRPEVNASRRVASRSPPHDRPR